MMTEQDKREKVIKGLECCKIPFTKCYNGGCPYFENEGCKARLKNDALALLKAQEPRVLTLEEVKQTYKKNSVWLENKGKMFVYKSNNDQQRTLQVVFFDSYMWAPEQYLRMHFLVFEEMIEYVYPGVFTYEDKDYGIEWRCWNAEPTDEQMKVVPWN